MPGEIVTGRKAFHDLKRFHQGGVSPGVPGAM